MPEDVSAPIADGLSQTLKELEQARGILAKASSRIRSGRPPGETSDDHRHTAETDVLKAISDAQAAIDRGTGTLRRALGGD